MKWRRIVSSLGLLIAFTGAPFPAYPEDGGATPSPETAAAAPDQEQSSKRLVERVRVSGTRLSDRPDEASRIPAHVTVYTREMIESSGAVTLQEFLAMRSDFVVFDEVGNGVQSTADLRGFNTGSLATSALVMLDGVRVNEPDTDYVNFVLLPLSEVERIEVIRGSSSALFGEGGLGGVINVVTRRGGEATSFGASVAGGSFGTQDYHLTSGGKRGDFRYRGGFRRRLSEGFRDNADTRISSFQLGTDYALSHEQSVGFDLTAGTNHLNQPGALTRQELEADRTQNPFNEHDFSATELWLPSVHYRLLLANGLSLTSRLSFRSADEQSFTGGRSLQGSSATVDRKQIAWTAQASHETARGPRNNQLVVGWEISRDSFDASGKRTDGEGTSLPQSDLSFAVSRSDSQRRLVGVFLQDTFAFNERWSAVAGLRLDEIKLDSEGERSFWDFPPPTFSPVFTQQPTDGERSFSRLSPKLGFNANPAESDSFYAGYSKGFRAPTVIELFAFPIFFSNPDLRPITSDDFEGGWNHRFRRGVSLAVNAFWIDVKDEIFFVVDTSTCDPSVSFCSGVNLNLPRTRRRGAVATLQSPLGKRLNGELGITYTDATFRSSFSDASIGNEVEKGDRLPQIPRMKYSAGLDIALPQGWKVNLQDIYVGSQVLTSDLANVSRKLDPYNLLNARVAYEHERWTAWAQIDNVLDKEYSTRGIYAFNFSTFAFDQFFTPAPGRSLLAGVSLRY
ncbi:MAG TPA: TonB-dependent receptor [Candidatus Polarisedimenticolia bacterium]|nr:TonB-dependent receptor [Candidatus Polarisedimenticolia bacterium]